jgi:hypothetical protein
VLLPLVVKRDPKSDTNLFVDHDPKLSFVEPMRTPEFPDAPVHLGLELTWERKSVCSTTAVEVLQ